MNRTVILAKINRPMEFIFLAGSIIGFLLKISHNPGANEILMISMSGLAAIYFMRAYIPVASPPAERNTLSLLSGSILPKVSMMACSVVVVALLFHLLHLHGDAEMAIVGCPLLGITIVLSVFFLVKDFSAYSYLLNYLYRTVPLFYFSFNLLMSKLG